MATGATAATTAAALDHPDHGLKVEDTSTSRLEQAESSQQMSHAVPAAEAAAMSGGRKNLRKTPPGFDASPDLQSAAVKPMRDRPHVKYEACHPSAVASSSAPSTAVGSSSQLQSQHLPTKPMPAGRPQRYRPDEAEAQLAAEQSEGDQEAKRSRTGQSPHHPHPLTPSPPESAAEEELQVSTCLHSAHPMNNVESAFCWGEAHWYTRPRGVPFNLSRSQNLDMPQTCLPMLVLGTAGSAQGCCRQTH